MDLGGDGAETMPVLSLRTSYREADTEIPSSSRKPEVGGLENSRYRLPERGGAVSNGTLISQGEKGFGSLTSRLDT